MKKQLIGFLRATLPSKLQKKIFYLGFNLVPEEFERFAHEYAFAPNMRLGLEKLASRGFAPKVIADVGGYEGNWARMAKSIWPDAHLVIFEANEEKRPKLSKVARDLNADLHFALLGPEDGADYQFNVMESGSSVFEENSPLDRKQVSVKSAKLDTLLDGVAPDLVKIDVQGFEIQVLTGAEATLRTASAVLLEVSFIEINKGAPLCADVIAFMASKGFVPLDILEIHRRPLDGATNQIDIIFARKDSPLLSDTRHF